MPAENLIRVTSRAAYGSEAADGRVPDSTPACYPVAVQRRERLEAEILVLRQQLIVLSRQPPARVRLRNTRHSHDHGRVLAILSRLRASAQDASEAFASFGPGKNKRPASASRGCAAH